MRNSSLPGLHELPTQLDHTVKGDSGVHSNGDILHKVKENNNVVALLVRKHSLI